MLSLTHRGAHSYFSLGKRRGTSDSTRFPVDLGWPKEEPHFAQSRAYPSPPMSGSPPLPPRRNPDASDRGQGSYGSMGQDVYRGSQTSQSEVTDPTRAPPLRPFQPDTQGLSAYAQYGMEGMSSAPLQYQPRPPVQQQQQSPFAPQHPIQYSMPDRPSGGEGSAFSPKTPRKTKGHVASACVPCKRAHLRCDAQRPCSRCLSNGKEDTCVDVQHKKRGRPRLRDEREPRYEGLGLPSGILPPDAGRDTARRPMSMYSPDIPVSTPFVDPLQRTGSYRVLKSQGGGPCGLRYPEHTSPTDTNIYGAGSVPLAPRMPGFHEPPCAYLTMTMQIAKATHVFGEYVGVQSITGRKLIDIVSQPDRDKVLRLERLFDEERREREPNYLPPIFLKYEEDRVIQSVGFSPEEMAQLNPNRTEWLMFQGADGQQRSLQAQLGLAKRDSTYFIVVVLNMPAQQYQQPLSSPYPRESYSRDSHSRDSQYGFQAPQQSFAQHQVAGPFMSASPYGDPRMDPRSKAMGYRAPGPLGHSGSPTTGVPILGQPQPRQEYSQGGPYQTPRSELRRTQSQRQDLQLPPIRDQRDQDVPSDSKRRRESRSGRLDIGGLLEKPGSGRRT